MKKVLVHLHLFYQDQLEYFIEKLSNITECHWDLVVTFIEDNPKTIKTLKEFKPDVKFLKIDNLGYDILPFLKVLQTTNLDDYDYVLKLHTKNFYTKCVRLKGLYEYSGYQWRDALVDALLKDKIRFKKNLKMLEKYDLVTDETVWVKLGKEAEDYEAKKLFNPKNNFYCAGTMFLSKIELFNKNFSYNEKGFDVNSKTSKGGSMAHVLERGFTLGKNAYLIKHPIMKLKSILFSIFGVFNSNEFITIHICGIRLSIRKNHKV